MTEAPNVSRLPVAVRAYTEEATAEDEDSGGSSRRKQPGWPDSVLVLDTETTTDETQCLIFGSYLYADWDEAGRHLIPRAEGLFYADDLAERDPDALETLQAYASEQNARVDSPYGPRQLRLYSRREFMHEVFWHAAFRQEALVVGFNLPFDLSRLAVSFGNARGWFRGGFSFTLWNQRGEKGDPDQEDKSKPRLLIKSINNKAAFIQFGTLKNAYNGRSDRPHKRGQFLDCRTLAFALTSRGHSLRSACEAFKVKHRKGTAEEHGRVTEDYISYNRQDVRATAALLEGLRAEFDRHPINLAPTRAFSPASIAKAYQRAMGLKPLREKFSDLPNEAYGYAMSAYYGGRAEARIRKTPVPVVYCDFLSMYPTVNSLLELWDYQTAATCCLEDCADEVRELLEGAALEDCFDPELWPQLRFFARIRPDGDVLPVRAEYEPHGGAYTIGVNPLYADRRLWYAGPDLLASVLLTGQVPEVEEVFHLVPDGQQEGLDAVELRGHVSVNPTDEDFFRTVIEARKSMDQLGLSEGEQARLDLALKVLANAGSYGIFAEMNRTELPEGEEETLAVYGPDGHFHHHTERPEKPGTYCFPPMAALTTAGARLMLALLERSVSDRGGTYAFCDTDSMAVVASRDGGDLNVPGTDNRRALSWQEVRELVEQFERLKPYDRDLVSSPVLEVEEENFRAKKCEEQVQLTCFAISAKRYVLYEDREDGPALKKWSEHGLGHLADPLDTDAEDRDWIKELWELLLAEELGSELGEPEWFDRAALSCIPISSPHYTRPLEALNAGRAYPNQIKPFNFLLSAHLQAGRYPADADPTEFQPIAPFTSDLSQWRELPWLNKYTGDEVSLLQDNTLAPWAAAVRTYREVFHRYRLHREPKSLDPGGGLCERNSRGLLPRRPVQLVHCPHIGKESNRLEDLECGMISDWEEVREEYGEDLFHTVVIPVLQRLSKGKIARETDLHPETIQAIRNHRQNPRKNTRKLLERFVKEILCQPEVA